MNPDKIPVTPTLRKFDRLLAQREMKGKQEALLGFLAARGLVVTADERARILACGDPTKLDRWIVRAATAAAAAEVFGASKRAPRASPARRRRQ